MSRVQLVAVTVAVSPLTEAFSEMAGFGDIISLDMEMMILSPSWTGRYPLSQVWRIKRGVHHLQLRRESNPQRGDEDIFHRVNAAT